MMLPSEKNETTHNFRWKRVRHVSERAAIAMSGLVTLKTGRIRHYYWRTSVGWNGIKKSFSPYADWCHRYTVNSVPMIWPPLSERPHAPYFNFHPSLFNLPEIFCWAWERATSDKKLHVKERTGAMLEYFLVQPDDSFVWRGYNWKSSQNLLFACLWHLCWVSHSLGAVRGSSNGDELGATTTCACDEWDWGRWKTNEA